MKTPKLYFLDSGLVCHLLGIRSREELLRSPFYGAVFEGFVVSETLKSQWSRAEEGDVYYFRDEQGLEVDLLFAPHAGAVTLVECKTSATVSPQMSEPMRKLAKAFACSTSTLDFDSLSTILQLYTAKTPCQLSVSIREIRGDGGCAATALLFDFA